MPGTGAGLTALGGIGLFLFGMATMTDGLRRLAGPALSRWLARSTRTVVSGTLTGAAATAVIQSSSATTVTAIGFVSAGLLTFEQALGLVYGANIGTSVTAWMVAVLGFKVDLAAIAPLFVLAGAIAGLTGKGRPAALGGVLAGFGLLFLGIGALQTGMEGLQGQMSPADLPRDTWLGRALLVGLGALLTVVVQSSSAALATALTALAAGSITLAQATAMVIGMNVGTTATALVAALGGTAAARRTAYAHLFFNLGTGLAAFGLLPLFPRALRAVAGDAAVQDPELALALFHTAFNVGGALLFLPLTGVFARRITQAIRDHDQGPARRLEPQLLQQPEVALEAVAATTRELARAALRHVALDLQRPGRAERRHVHAERLLADTVKARTFLSDITVPARDTRRRAAVVELFDALDHVGRMLERTRPSVEGRARTPAVGRIDVRLTARAQRLARPLLVAASALRDQGQGADVAALERASEAVEKDAQGLREEVLALTANGDLEPEESLARMDEVRRVTRVGRHAYRVAYHLERAGREVSAATPLAVPIGSARAE